MKTRDRILHKSLELFNELGEPNVTTLLISDELDISPGNLYYHFKSKTDILTNLFEWYETEIGALLEAPDAQMDIEDQWFFMHLIFEKIAKYQFIYKDILHVLGQHDSLKNKFNRVIKKKRMATQRTLESLRQEGTLKANDEEIVAICNNIVMTATFWINYCIVSQNGNFEADDLAKGVYQVISIVAPYLDDEQRAQLNELKTAYL